jgi:hypothetical protein
LTYSTQFEFAEGVLDEPLQRIFAPIVGAWFVQSSRLSINGQMIMSGFRLEHPWIVWDQTDVGYALHVGDNVCLQADYFYKTDRIHLLDCVLPRDYPSATAGAAKEIMSTHFIDGHFAFDNGLYKEAVSNFGTVAEALLNRTMENTALKTLITNDPVAKKAPTIQDSLNFIRELRNRVHPNQIKSSGNISFEDARSARHQLQKILHFFYLDAEKNIAPQLA